MDYCKSYFGKKINELTYSDVEHFFSTERSESDQLEFKSINNVGDINEKFSAIQKSICAFLNSNGGVLIWGAPKGQKVENKKEKIFKGELTYFNKILEKDFIISKISDNIIPLPSGLNAQIIEKDNSCIVVFEVQISIYSPHQTENTFYMRIDGQSRPAPHHYIEALFKKVKYPNIEALFKITKTEIYNGKFRVSFRFYLFNWTPLQNEENVMFRIISEHGKYGVKHRSDNRFYTLENQEYYSYNAKEILYYGEPLLEEEYLFFDPHKLSMKGNKSTIFISFGGKYSPLKSCEYELDFTNFPLSRAADLITSKSENILQKDIHDIKGVNKINIISSIMESDV